MFDSKAWKFVKKHKGKFFLGGALLLGSAYIVRKITKKIEEFQKIYQNNPHLHDPASQKSLEWKLNLQFQKNQQVSDSTVKKILPRMKSTIMRLYDIDALTSSLQDEHTRLSPKEKSIRFDNIKIQCISRLITSLYVLNFTLLLHRIEINIISGASHSKEQMNDNFAFLSSTKYIYTDGVQGIANCITKITESVFSDVSPTDIVTIDSLRSLFQQILNEANKVLRGLPLYDSCCRVFNNLSETILPEKISYQSTGEEKDVLETNLNIARDILDSPNAINLVIRTINASLDTVIKLLQERKFDEEFPVARSFGALCYIFDVITTSQFANVFIDQFSLNNDVSLFAVSIYNKFTDHPITNFSKSPSLAALLQ